MFMLNKKKPAQRGKPSQDSTQSGFYPVCRWFINIMLILAAISFALCYVQSPDCVARLENSLRKLFPPAAMAAAAALAGLPGVIFSGLLSRMGERVCGVKMADLIQDRYPSFFPFCFGFFIALSLMAALAGSADLFWPAFYAFLGVIVAVGWICRVCYVFLVKGDSQTEIAFSYYRKKLRESREKTSGTGSDQDWKLRRYLLNTAKYARALLLQEHQDWLRETAQLWMEVFSDRSMPIWNENTYFAPDDPIFQDCSLAASAWAALLPDGLGVPFEAQILHSMLDCIDEGIAGESETRYIYKREVLLLGLAQFLMETSLRGDNQEVKRLCSLTYGRQDRPADQDLICACLMMRTVEWMEANEPSVDDFACALYYLQPLLDKCLIAVDAWTARHSLADYLLCAESIICRIQCITPDEFLQRVREKLEGRQETHNMFIYLCQKEQRPELLSCLLQQISVLGSGGSATVGPEETQKSVVTMGASERASGESTTMSPHGANRTADTFKEPYKKDGKGNPSKALPDEVDGEPATTEPLDLASEEPATTELFDVAGEKPATAEPLDVASEEPATAEPLDVAGEKPTFAEVSDEADEEPVSAESSDATSEELTQAAAGLDMAPKKEV